MTVGIGYIAIVIHSFGRYNPVGVCLASIFFGFFDSLHVVHQNDKIPSQIVMMLPYVLTLAIIAIGVRNSRPPARLGKHFDD